MVRVKRNPFPDIAGAAVERHFAEKALAAESGVDADGVASGGKGDVGCNAHRIAAPDDLIREAVHIFRSGLRVRCEFPQFGAAEEPDLSGLRLYGGGGVEKLGLREEVHPVGFKIEQPETVGLRRRVCAVEPQVTAIRRKAVIDEIE